MERRLRFAGIVGLVLFMFGLGGSLVSGSFNILLLNLHIIAGLLLMALWFFGVGVRNLSEAGGVIKGRSTRFGASAALFTALFVGILVAVNWLAHRNNKRWDVTEQGVYSLADQSKRMIDNLQKPLMMVAFKVTDDPERLTDLLDLYKNRNPSKITTQLVDPRTKPQLIDKYQMKTGNVIYLEYGEGEKKQVSRINEPTEDAVTNAVLKLTRGEARKVYYVTGHGEPDIKNGGQGGLKAFAGALTDEHMTVEPILLSKSAALPQDAAAVLLVAPKKPLLPEERESLVKYAEGGGRLFLFADPRGGDDVRQLASRFGIEIGENVVLDRMQRLFAGPAIGAQPVVQQYGAHPITKGLTENDVSIFNIAASVRPSASKGEGATYTELAKTSPTSWAETNLALVFDAEEPAAEREEADIAGPVSLAVAYEKSLEAKPEGEKKEGEPSFEKAARVVVFGDSDWILNGNIGMYANRDLAMNTVNWLVGEEGGISIRPRSMKTSFAPIQAGTFAQILSTSFLIPELILILGLYIWWRRRQVSFV